MYFGFKAAAAEGKQCMNDVGDIWMPPDRIGFRDFGLGSRAYRGIPKIAA